MGHQINLLVRGRSSENKKWHPYSPTCNGKKIQTKPNSRFKSLKEHLNRNWRHTLARGRWPRSKHLPGWLLQFWSRMRKSVSKKSIKIWFLSAARSSWDSLSWEDCSKIWNFLLCGKSSGWRMWGSTVKRGCLSLFYERFTSIGTQKSCCAYETKAFRQKLSEPLIILQNKKLTKWRK